MSKVKRIENRMVALADCTPHPRNYNKHSDAQLKDLRESLKQFGQVRSIVVQSDKTGKRYTIVAGHGIVQAAQAENYTELRADVIPSNWSETRVLAYLAADNELGKHADPDADQLAAIVRAVRAVDGEVLALLAAGEQAALDAILNAGSALSEAAETAGELVDKAAELQKKWQVQRGDVWEIGRHRLMCGDSTSAEDVARLMGGERASLTVTSPPYFNQREYSQWESYEDYLSFVALIVGETSRALSENAIFVVNIGSDEQARRWMPSDWWTIIRDSDANWLYRECIAWVKAAAVWNVPRSMHIENGHYFPAQRWEVMLVASRGKHPSFEKSDRDAVREFDENVWTIPVVSGQEQKAIGHNAPFPLEIPRRFIMAYTTKDKLVYEPFCGSGTTLAACELLGRAGRGMEFSEKYCAVTLERMSLLGLAPKRLSETVVSKHGKPKQIAQNSEKSGRQTRHKSRVARKPASAQV